MKQINAYLLIFVILTGMAVDAAADESICTPRKQNHGALEIKELYQKYKSSAELADVFLKSVGSGFTLGIQGYPAHMRMPAQDMTKDSAGAEGFNAGYHHGLDVYCMMNKPVDRRRQEVR
jgi:hypothetical protein